MDIRVLGSDGSTIPGHHTNSLLVNGSLLIDAGTVTSILTLEEQAAVSDVVITHAHLDHVVDLAFLVDNGFARRRTSLRVWAPQQVLDTLHSHLFNDLIWPDFTRILSAGVPALELLPLTPGKEVEISGIGIRSAQTNHPVHTVGYALTDRRGTVLVCGDTTTTEEIWALGRTSAQLRMVFVETSFPDRCADLAVASGHMTPAMLKTELTKLGRDDVPIKVFHMKLQFLDEILEELNNLEVRQLQILQGGEFFSF
jgi:cAMP phosphodiesterase